MSRRLTPVLLAGAFLLFVASCDGSTPVDPLTSPAAITVVSGDGQSTTVGQVLGAPLVVKVTLGSGAAAVGVTVAFQVTSGGGSVSPASVTTDSSGVAQATVTAGPTAGPLAVRASAGAVSVTAAATVTTVPVLAELKGRWVGTTSQSRAVTLWVGSTGVIDSLSIAASVSIPLGTCTVTYVPANITLGSSANFTVTLASASGITGSMTGTFTSTQAVSGTFNVAWEGVVICGNTITFGTGGSGATGTWSAQRSPLGVSSVSPNGGALVGGNTVTVNGWFESSVDSVKFGTNRLSNVVRVSNTQVTGTVPAGASAAQVGVIVYSGATSATCSNCYRYNAVPVVTSTSPVSASVYGGTSVTINGTDFPVLSAIDSVRIGEARLDSVTRLSSTQLRGNLPAATQPGPVNVTVFTSTAGSGSCTSCFTYSAPGPISVTSVSPNNGSMSGGATVAIIGAEFPPTIDSVVMGAEKLTSVVRVTGARIIGALPARGAAGGVNVTVYAAGGSGSCAACFTYNPAMTVVSVTPATGSTDGKIPVSITGANFPTTIDSVQFGGQRLTNVQRVSATRVTGTTATGPLGSAPVQVFSAFASGGACADCFTYTQPVIWAAVAVGSAHTCGITNANVAFCWGDNFSGQVGDSSTTDRTVATAVRGGHLFGAVSTGGSHTCGLKSDGAAWCWGSNSNGRLGDSTSTNRTKPVAVKGGLSFAALGSGGAHTCGLVGGAAYCWGLNVDGQLGDGSLTSRSTPVLVGGGVAFASLSVGGVSNTCGLTSAGAAYCWGDNASGQVGDSSTIDRNTPTAVLGGIAFASISVGTAHACGLTVAGAAYCWGSNGSGRLGDGSTTNRGVPTAVSGGLTFASIAAGGSHTCAITSGGAAYCWGENSSGQLGTGATTDRSTPTAVTGGVTFSTVSAGASHSCAMTGAGAAYCWGSNTFGRLGDGTTTSRSAPVAVVSP